MKLLFIPRDIGMWRDDFDFSQDITLTPKAKPKEKEFHDYNELIEFLKKHRVRLDDPKYPLEFLDENSYHHGICKAIVQFSLIGWVKEIY